MHILLIHQAFASLDEPGGTRHHEFARFLADEGHQVSIIASKVSYLTGSSGNHSKSIEYDMDGKITIYRSYTYSALHKSFIHRIISYFSFMVSSFFTAIKIKNIDVVWGTTPPIFQSVTAWLIATLKRTPFLLEIRDLWPAFAVAVGVLKNKAIIHLSLWLEKFLYHHADKIIVNSPGFIDHVQSRGGQEVALIPNGADERYFNADSSISLRKELDWEGKFVVLYAGAHGMSNDLEIVLQTAKLLQLEKQILFIFLGDGKEKNILIQKATDMQLSNVQFLNPVPKTEIANYLQASDACLAILKPIELYKTTYPNKVFDYMAAGKPVILAIDGVIREVVESANCGYFCEPGNPEYIANIIRKMDQLDKKAFSLLGSNGKRYLNQHFDRKIIAESFSDILDKMVNQNA